MRADLAVNILCLLCCKKKECFNLKGDVNFDDGKRTD